MNDVAICNFVESIADQFKSAANMLIEIISQSSAKFDSAIKWKQLTFTLEEDFHHWIIAISQTKKYLSLNFHYGGLLDDSKNRFSIGKSKFFRKIEIRDESEIDKKFFLDLINQAIERREFFINNWKELNYK